jgi:diaminohydroxyphosphoribosylaminopyrimidine deaminase/5-amino-6-(5-phosphoribosylamino)uracil reductase
MPHALDQTQQPEDGAWMATCLRLAARGLGNAWPNPAVGCVVVKAGRCVARGWTQPGGRPHAETEALARAGEAARGATAYISLEPCAHWGRTPPCTKGLIEAGVARVVTAVEDPDPRVAGAGHAQLRAAGIPVTENVARDEARWLNAGFFTRIRDGRPLVALKLAQSLDGRIATAAGESRWITGPEARALGHRLRAEHDAIMVGSGTAAADDPELTCRLDGLEARSPVRVVVDGRASLSPVSRLARTARAVPTWLLTGEDAATGPLEAAGVRVLRVASDHAGHLDVAAGLRALAGEGLTRVLVEGGAGLAGALTGRGVVDRLYLFAGGRVLGGDGLAAIGAFGLEALADAPRFRHIHNFACGPDRLQLWTRAD